MKDLAAQESRVPSARAGPLRQEKALFLSKRLHLQSRKSQRKIAIRRIGSGSHRTEMSRASDSIVNRCGGVRAAARTRAALRIDRDAGGLGG